MSGCSPCVVTTTTTISFTFNHEERPTAPPPTSRQRAASVDSLEYDYSVETDVSSGSPMPELVPEPPLASGSNDSTPLAAIGLPSLTAAIGPSSLPAVIGPPGLTLSAAQRWYAVTIGTSVGVFQGS